MAELAPNKPFASAVPVIDVENMPVGTHIFQLQVQDNLGQVSDAVTLTVIIRPITGAQEPVKP